MYDAKGLENVRRRQERAIRYVTGRTGYAHDDPDKCMRATYTIVMNDVPAMAMAIEELLGYVTNLTNALREEQQRGNKEGDA